MKHIRIPAFVRNCWQKLSAILKPAGAVRRFCDRLVIPALHLYPVVQEDRHYFYIYRHACTSPFTGRLILPDLPSICLRKSKLTQRQIYLLQDAAAFKSF